MHDCASSSPKKLSPVAAHCRACSCPHTCSHPPTRSCPHTPVHVYTPPHAHPPAHAPTHLLMRPHTYSRLHTCSCPHTAHAHIHLFMPTYTCSCPCTPAHAHIRPSPCLHCPLFSSPGFLFGCLLLSEALLAQVRVGIFLTLLPLPYILLLV